MRPEEETKLWVMFIEALNNIATGMHDIADAMRTGPEDTVNPVAPQYLDQGTTPPKPKPPAPPPEPSTNPVVQAAMSILKRNYPNA